MKPILVLVGFLAVPFACPAGETSYECQVVEHLVQGAGGTIGRPKNPHLIGARLVIDRRTGQVSSSDPYIVRSNARIQVVAPGNEESSFVATVSSRATGGGVHFALVRVEEYAFEKLKPFLLTDGGTVLSGLCQ